MCGSDDRCFPAAVPHGWQFQGFDVVPWTRPPNQRKGGGEAMFMTSLAKLPCVYLKTAPSRCLKRL